MKPVLMIHECSAKLLDLPLADYILTFDDGLLSQFAFFQEIRYVPTPKIFFISTGIVCEGPQSLTYPSCEQAHAKAFLGIKEDYMTLEQIKILAEDPWVTIGGHSHSHTKLTGSLVDKVKHIEQDTELMLQWFDINLGFRPTRFCFPYNEDPSGIYKGLLKKKGFTDFYGAERTPIEMLLQSYNPLDIRDTLLV